MAPPEVAGELVSIAGLRGRSVYDRTGLRVGRLVALVVRLDTEDAHPLINGALVRAEGRLVYIAEAGIVGVHRWEMYLCTVGLDRREQAGQQIDLDQVGGRRRRGARRHRPPVPRARGR
jgi:sporulation protein YlmC with PRC-barrel domain